MKTLKIGLIGAGERGAHCYAPYALKYPQEMQFTAVAEPLADRRDFFRKTHGIADEMCFTGWEQMLEARPELDGVIIANQDQQHYEPAMAMLEAGYHVLLEKPMAETLEKSVRIVEKAKEKNRLLMICHVLRYTDFYRSVKEVIQSGKLGKVMNIDQVESIGNWHFSHSYVRGNWNNKEASTPMIVAKCSHDMDIISYLLDKKCLRLSSFGSLSYFVKENAPADAALRCTDCVLNKTCNYSAYRYLTDKPQMDIFRNIVMKNADNQEFIKNLETSPYGRCVYHCDNNVADHQVVSMEYEDGVIASFTASAFARDIKRQIKVMGTLAELEGCIEDDSFEVKYYGSHTVEKHNLITPKTLHSGGDERIMAHFSEALRNPHDNQYSAEFSLMGHRMAFAAEESRLKKGEVIEL